jgi:NAD(P)H-dependent FMN reductase
MHSLRRRRKPSLRTVRRKPPLQTVRIVGLNGSPRRDGNTATLMHWVLEGCSGAGAEVEWIHLAEYHVGYCQGCFTCLQTGTCPLEDDFQAVRDRLLAADGIVVGSPVYGGQATAQLKTFLDRLTLLNLYTHTFERQWSVGVATSGVAPTRGLARGLAMLLGRPSGIVGAKTASVARGYRPLVEAHSPRLPTRARAVGRRLVANIECPRRLRAPSLGQLWHRILMRLVIRPLVTGHPDQFAGVLRIWEEKGWFGAGGSAEARGWSGCPERQVP